ncbi:hypothetical protein BH11ACT2_BH11ACT2_09850 [soil metagenome]
MHVRSGIFAASTAAALIVSALASPAHAATAPAGAVYSTGGSNAAANVVPALPAGVTYTKVSAGTTQTLYLRSDGQVVGAGSNTAHSLDIPALPAGVTYTDVDATGDVTVLVRSDGKIVFASDPYAKPLHVPELPAGVSYTKVFSGGTSVTALRSDGKAVMFATYYDDRFLDPTPPTSTPAPTATSDPAPVANPTPVYWERTTTDSDYVSAATSASDYVLLMHATGKVKAVDIRASRAIPIPQITVPKLPAGMRYESLDAGSVAAYVRSDGVALVDGVTNKGAIAVPKAPKGITYKQVSVGDYSIALLRSDGQVVVSGYPDSAGVKPTVPTMTKGWRYTAISDNASHLALRATQLQAGESVQTSISYVHRPTTVVRGSVVTYTVKLFSMAATRGGTVTVTYKDKVIGSGVVGAGAVATIHVSTTSMPKHARNKVGVQFLGTAQAKKSSGSTRYVGYIRTKP